MEHLYSDATVNLRADQPPSSPQSNRAEQGIFAEANQNRGGASSDFAARIRLQIRSQNMCFGNTPELTEPSIDSN